MEQKLLHFVLYQTQEAKKQRPITQKSQNQRESVKERPECNRWLWIFDLSNRKKNCCFDFWVLVGFSDKDKGRREKRENDGEKSEEERREEKVLGWRHWQRSFIKEEKQW